MTVIIQDHPLYAYDPESGLMLPSISGGADFPMADIQRRDAVGESGAVGTTLTAAASVDTKGSWVSIVDPIPFNACGIWVYIGGISTANISFLVDIGIAAGGGGSEHVRIPNLGYNSHGGLDFWARYYVPISLKKDKRLIARCQSSTASSTVGVFAMLEAPGFYHPSPYQRVTDYGTVNTGSRGTSVDPGATANTKGSWVQLSASTTNPIRALCFFVGNQLNSVRSDARYLVDIGVGAATAEQVVIPDVPCHADTGTDVLDPMGHGPFYATLPKSKRLVTRGLCSITDATDRLFDIIAYGVD